MEYIFSQISGFIALILVCISFFTKSKTSFLIYQITSSLFYALSYLLLGVFSAGTISILSTVRCIFYYFFDKYNISYRRTIFILPVIICMYITLALVFWISWLDIIPVITASLFSVAYYIKNINLVRYLTLPPNCILLIYSIFNKAYTNTALHIIQIVVLTTAIIKFHAFKNNKKQKA